MAQSLDRFYDGSLDGNDRSKRFGTGFACFLSGFFHVIARLFFRYEVTGQENLRQFIGKKNGAVLVAPHVSYVDAVLLFLSARPKQWVRLMGKSDLFTCMGGLLGSIVARVGAFPVTRDSADTTAIKRAARMLKNGELVGLFPEGTRRGKGNVESALHGGAALIARMGKAPLVPVGLVNVDQVKRKGERVHFPKLGIAIGKPYALSAFDFLPKEDRLEGATWFVMREAFALSRGCSPSKVDMRSLFPEGKDFSREFSDNFIEPLDVSTLPDYVQG